MKIMAGGSAGCKRMGEIEANWQVAQASSLRTYPLPIASWKPTPRLLPHTPLRWRDILLH